MLRTWGYDLLTIISMCAIRDKRLSMCAIRDKRLSNSFLGFTPPFVALRWTGSTNCTSNTHCLLLKKRMINVRVY